MSLQRRSARFGVGFISLLCGVFCVASARDLSGHMIGIYGDAGAHVSCTSSAGRMFRWMGFSTRTITADDVNDGRIDDLSAVYFPGGSSPPYIQRITADGKARLLDSMDDGMAFIGTCAGAMFAAEVQVWEGMRYTYGQLRAFRGEAVGPALGVCESSAGVCTTDLRTTAGHPIAQGLPETFLVTHYNSPFFRFSPDAETHVLASYERTGEPAVVAQRRGSGWVLLTGPHPEWQGLETWQFMKHAVLWALNLWIPPEG